MKRLPRPLTTYTLALVLALGVIAGCVDETEPSPTPAPPTTAPPDDDIEELDIPPADVPAAIAEFISREEPADTQYDGATVTVLLASLPAAQTFQWFAPAIKTRYDIDVHVVRVPFDRINQAIINDLAARVGAYDVFLYPPRMLGDLVANGFLVSLDEYASRWDPALDDVDPAYRELYNYFDGSLYSLMMDGDRLELYYRADLFEHPDEMAAFEEAYGYTLGPPSTWDEYLDLAEFFTRPAGSVLAGEELTEDFFGISEFTRAPDVFSWWLNRFASHGGVYFNEDFEPQINTEAGILATENMIAALEYGPPDIINFGYPESHNAFINGQTAMVIQWSDVAKGAQNPEASDVVDKVGYAQIPGVISNGTREQRSVMAYSRVMSISALSQVPEAAYQVIRFMHDPEVSLLYVTGFGGLDPFRISHYERPGDWVAQWDTLPDYIANTRQSIENAYPELTMPGALRYQQVLGEQVARALAGEIQPAEALAEVERQWNRITDELNRDLQLEFWRNQLEAWRSVGLDPSS